MQRLVDAALIRAERAAALQDECDGFVALRRFAPASRSMRPFLAVRFGALRDAVGAVARFRASVFATRRMRAFIA